MLTLPIPSNEAVEHSALLFDRIRKEIIKSGGSISFARFMEMALYTPSLGYYCAGSQKLGKSGDFTTAPEMSPLFARCLAHQCQQILEMHDDSDILEIGAGSGKMACDLLMELDRLDCLPRHYYILEISANLRARQQQLISLHPRIAKRVKWLNELPQDLKGVVLGNEVLDALPITCFRMEMGEVRERRVKMGEKNFCWQISDSKSERLEQQIQLIQKSAALSDGYESEVNLLLYDWIKALANSLTQGLILLLDYGYGRREFYHPERRHGTLMCHYQHHRHADPFQLIGLQDITAHVDFTLIAEAASDSGLKVSGFTTQAAFLLANGLMDLAEERELPLIEEYQQNQAIKMYTLPSQMGELIKAIGLTKGIKSPLIGFQTHDRRRDL